MKPPYIIGVGGGGGVMASNVPLTCGAINKCVMVSVVFGSQNCRET